MRNITLELITKIKETNLDTLTLKDIINMKLNIDSLLKQLDREDPFLTSFTQKIKNLKQLGQSAYGILENPWEAAPGILYQGIKTLKKTQQILQRPFVLETVLNGDLSQEVSSSVVSESPSRWVESINLLAVFIEDFYNLSDDTLFQMQKKSLSRDDSELVQGLIRLEHITLNQNELKITSLNYADFLLSVNSTKTIQVTSLNIKTLPKVYYKYLKKELPELFL